MAVFSDELYNCTTHLRPQRQHEQISSTTTYSYSGVPSRLAAIAQAAKDRLYSHKMVPESLPRPETTRAAFDEAITAPRKHLGQDNVVLNNKPLVDGWYLEHPNTHDAFHPVN
jgi:hypothetical protein